MVFLVKVVTVKADEWRQRTSKVMGQAKPQLEVVRELFHEGQNLGFGRPGAEADTDKSKAVNLQHAKYSTVPGTL